MLYSASFKKPFSSLIKAAICEEVNAFPAIWRPSLDKIWILLATASELLTEEMRGENVLPEASIDPDAISDIDDAIVKVPLEPDANMP